MSGSRFTVTGSQTFLRELVTGNYERLLLLLLLLLAIATPAFAQFEVGGRYIATTEQKTGALELRTCQGFGAFAEKFWSERWSARVEARFLQPAAFLGETDLGTLGIQPVALTTRFHFAPAARFSPYAGAGAAYVFFGNLDDQFGDAIDVEFDPELAFVGEAGVRFRVHDRIYFDFGVTYMPVDAQSDVTVTINPVVVGAAASWRF